MTIPGDTARTPAQESTTIEDPNTVEGRRRFAENNPGVVDARSGLVPPVHEPEVIVESSHGPGPAKRKESDPTGTEIDKNGRLRDSAPQTASQNNVPIQVGDDGDQSYERPLGSVRKQDYPTRERRPTRDRLEEAATGADGQIRCQSPDCTVEDGRILAPGEGTVEHNPPLVQTHNEQGYNTDQETRNDLYNETATEIHCIECQRRQGGQMKEKYRRDVGPEYEPRQPRRKKE